METLHGLLCMLLSEVAHLFTVSVQAAIRT